MIKAERSIRGFTLIELLVVLFIISIVTTVALLSVSHNDNKKIDAFTKEFMQVVTLSEEQAILEPAVLGVLINKNAYEIVSYQLVTNEKGEKKIHWNVIQDKLFASREIPNGIELNIEATGKKSNDDEEEVIHDPQIVISTNGDITPFTIYVSKKGNAPRYLIKGEADGSITSKLMN